MSPSARRRSATISYRAAVVAKRHEPVALPHLRTWRGPAVMFHVMFNAYWEPLTTTANPGPDAGPGIAPRRRIAMTTHDADARIGCC